MTYEINKVGVIGSGTMGSGIAALLAGVDIPVVLLDIPQPGSSPGDKNRNAIVDGNIKKLSKSRPAQLFVQSDLDLIQTGNTEDNLDLLADCDWIIEVIIEKLAPKQELMARLEEVRKERAIVTTNTSGLRIKDIADGRSEDFQRHFMGTHFFNPPRYLRLLEIIPHEKTDPALVDFMFDFGSRTLGKGCVLCKDTPNFIGNRFMSVGGMMAINYAIDHGYTVEEVDSITGPLIGHPKSATFRLNDIVGIDIAKHVSDNLYDAIPEDDWREALKHEGMERVFDFLMSNNLLGSKTGQGFYKTVKGEGGKEFWSLDFETLEYQAPQKPRFESVGKHRKVEDTAERIRLMVNEEDRAGQYLWHLHAGLLAYASQKLGEITDDIVSIDNALKWGFAYELGPFEIWDALGVEATLDRINADYPVADWVREMVAAGYGTFYSRDENGIVTGYYDPKAKDYAPLKEDKNVVVIDNLRATGKEIERFAGASLIDMGDGVGLLEFHSKMNTIDDDIVKMVMIALDRMDSDLDGLVIGNQGDHFSVGANIALAAMAVAQGALEQVEEGIKRGQQVYQALRYGKKPVVSAPFGMTLGGGAEITMTGWRIVAHAECYMGLVEMGVGLNPAWSGCKEMLRRVVNPVMESSPNADVLPHLQKVFEQIGTAKVSGSAMEAREMGFLKATDRIVLNRDHLLAEAKREVLGLIQSGADNGGPGKIYAAGRDALAALNVGVWQLRDAGYASEYDEYLGKKLAYVLTGGDLSAPQWVPEQYFLDLEREVFLELLQQPKTQERIMHTLNTGKPLRN